jgi:hypothetical protein
MWVGLGSPWGNGRHHHRHAAELRGASHVIARRWAPGEFVAAGGAVLVTLEVDTLSGRGKSGLILLNERRESPNVHAGGGRFLQIANAPSRWGQRPAGAFRTQLVDERLRSNGFARRPK